ncbi:MAG: hypothetical protein HYR56_16945 [Acidobacteria bacterium]|nr:hypothetical protein [Acidobacteriota bacterium]MBI3428013.1 hypothetical protein [Acidobacteriota bacterium]
MSSIENQLILKRAQEQIVASNNSLRKQRFTDEIQGNRIGGVRWVGNHAKHLEHLEKLAKLFGENSVEVDTYIADQKTLAKHGVHPNPFPSIGFGNPTAAAGTATGLLDAKARKLMSESGGAMEYTEALGLAVRQNPGLYEQHVARF